MATYQPQNHLISLTQRNGSNASRGFDSYSNLKDKPGSSQVSTLMGDAAEDMFWSFCLEEAGGRGYDTVVEKFNNHFMKNIYKRAELNMR